MNNLQVLQFYMFKFNWKFEMEIENWFEIGNCLNYMLRWRLKNVCVFRKLGQNSEVVGLKKYLYHIMFLFWIEILISILESDQSELVNIK